MNFNEKVFKAVQSIPYGKVASYGTIAEIVGNKRASRQVGFALHKNKDPKIVPCYRVVFKDGRLSKAFVFGGENAQRAMLESEGVTLDERGRVQRCFFV